MKAASLTETPSGVSAIRRQVMWNRLLAVVEEQAQTLLRTAFSPIVREAGIFLPASSIFMAICWPRLSPARRAM